MTNAEILNAYQDYVCGTYTKTEAVFVKGKGMTLTDIHGKKYLDFFPGWGVNNVGHCHPKVIAAVRDQIGKLIHVPNNFYHPNQAKLAKEIIKHSFPGKVFFGNSGAEACEGGIKLARAYGFEKGRTEIITMEKSFHGRTFGAMSATGQPAYHQGFGSLVAGFKYAPFNDIEAIKKLINQKTAAVILELVQGEGGVNIADKNYIMALRQLCDKHNILLGFDEVQTGMGRTGEMFAFKHYNVRPDFMMLAKALGGGLPIGALVCAQKVQDVLKPGMHASTFGGSPLVTKAALGTFAAIKTDHMLKNCKKTGKYISDRLQELNEKHRLISEIRSLGLMIGIELMIPGEKIFEDCFEKGLIINCTQGNVLRFMPALNVTKKQADKAIHILDQVLTQTAKDVEENS